MRMKLENLETNALPPDEGTYPLRIGPAWRDDVSETKKPGITFFQADPEVPLRLPPSEYFESIYTKPDFLNEQARSFGWLDDDIFTHGFSKEMANRALVAELYGVTAEDDDLTYDIRREAVGKVLYGKGELNDDEFFAATTQHYQMLHEERDVPPVWLQPEDESEFPEIVERARLIALGRAYAEDAASRRKRPMAELDDDSMEYVGRQVLRMQHQQQRGDATQETQPAPTVLSRVADGVKLVGGGIADGTLAVGEGFYNQYAQILRRSLPDAEWAQNTADEAERLSGEFDQLRAAYAEVYKVDEPFANSFTGQLLTGTGQMVPQTLAVLLPGVGIAALQSQAFQDGWEDAERVAAESATPFDPNRAFAYAQTVAVASTLLNTIKIKGAVLPWTRKIAGGKIRQATMNIFRAAVTGGLASSAQGAMTDAAANVWGIEERNVFDPEKRGKEFLIGAGSTGTLSVASASVRVLNSKIESSLYASKLRRSRRLKVLLQKISRNADKIVDEKTSSYSPHSLSNVQARDLYNEGPLWIRSILEQLSAEGKDLEQQAIMAFFLREKIRKKIRLLMRDRPLADRLDREEKSYSWEYIYNKYKGDHNEIIQASQRTNEKVNREIQRLKSKGEK